jgi:probable phosphoglycerate mutase
MTTVLLIRHGLNDWVGKRLAGRTPDVHLNEQGRKQAQMLVSVLKDLTIDSIYSSPLERAIETAKPLALAKELPVICNENLQEIDFGEWQGKTIKQLRKLKLWKLVHQEPEKFRFPGGESFVEAQLRLSSVIETFFSNHPEDEIVACFSHSDSIRLILAHFLGLPLQNFHKITIDTASISVLYRKAGQTSVPYINQIIDKPFGNIFNKK